MENRPEISILIPVFNERENLEPLVGEIHESLGNEKSASRSYEIVMVDDGSKDGSRETMLDLAKKNSNLKALFFRRNVGQTAAFDAGFKHASGRVIVTMDSDLQNDPKDIPKMLDMLDDGYDFVAGWRKNRKDGFFLRTFPSRIANWIIRKVTRTSIRDLGCSLKVYRKEITDELRLYGEMHRFIGVYVEGMGAKVGQYITHHRPRQAGTSKYNLFRTFKVLIDLITVWFLKDYRSKPGYVFGGFGGLLLLASALVSVWVLWDKFVLDVYVHKNPLFLISILFAIVGVQFIGLGLLAELLIRNYYETSGKEPYQIVKRVGFSNGVDH